MDTVTLQTISAFPGKLTDMASDPKFVPRAFQPYVKESNNAPGLAVSISDFLTYSALASNQGEQRPRFDVENASKFQQDLQATCTPDTINWWPDNGADFKLLAFNTRKNKPPTGMVLVSPELSKDFQRAVESADAFDYTAPCPMAFNFFSQEHPPLAGHVVKNGRYFSQRSDEISELVNDEGLIVWRPDRSIAAVSCDTALLLKANLFNGDGDVIKDLPIKQFYNSPQLYANEMNNNGTFFRLGHPQNYRRKEKINLYTLIPWYAAHSLRINDDGTIEGIKPPSRLTETYNINAFVRTDYNRMHLTLGPPCDRERAKQPKKKFPANQQQTISRALSPEFASQITVQGRIFTACEHGETNQPSEAQKRFPTVYDSHAEFSASLTQQGRVTDTSLTIGFAQHIASLAVNSIDTLTIKAAGGEFHFTPLS